METGEIEGDWVRLSEIIGWTRGQKARLGANTSNRGWIVMDYWREYRAEKETQDPAASEYLG